MGDAIESAAKRPRLPERDVQSLGWLTESATQPKKHRFVEGVGARGLPEMHAQLYKLEQEAAMKKAAGESLTRSRRPLDSLGRANAGVAERDKLDQLQAPTEANRLAESQAALERKAALYDRLARGEGTEEEEERYNVDFFGKAAYPPPDADALANAANLPGSRAGVGALQHQGGDPAASREQAHEQWVRESEQSYAEMTAEEERRQRRVDTVFELERETKEGRRRAAEEKKRRSVREDAKRQQLKAAMLKQLAGKVKAIKAAAAASRS